MRIVQLKVSYDICLAQRITDLPLRPSPEVCPLSPIPPTQTLLVSPQVLQNLKQRKLGKYFRTEFVTQLSHIPKILLP